MAVPHGVRFPIAFDDLFPQGAYLMGDIQPLTEYQCQEDKARNRPVRPRIDEWVAFQHERTRRAIDAFLVENQQQAS